MQNLKDPLIFIVEDNSVYNKLVVSYLRSQKFTRVESYLSVEDCLKNSRPYSAHLVDEFGFFKKETIIY